MSDIVNQLSAQTGISSELVEKGVLSASVEATYSLDQYREAIAHAQRPERSGKVLFAFDQAGRADTPR